MIIRDLLAFSVGFILALLLLLLLSGCVGVVDDYATAANALGEQTSVRTIIQLQRKHDTEAAAYAAAYCGQPRIGAVERRYQDPELLAARRELCDIERMIGFGGP